jgi:hypothetical protein
MNIPAKSVLRRLKHLAIDNLEILTGQRDRLTPPKRLIFVGPGSFSEIGNEFFRYFVEFGFLEPFHQVLDIGSGIGRMAVPLTRFLNERGTYDGLEINKIGVIGASETFTAVSRISISITLIFSIWNTTQLESSLLTITLSLFLMATLTLSF